MIFEEIRIHNLFSYYGEQVFSLPDPTPEQPIVLISGRNGYGKTSFINSIKLLFLGTSEEMLTSVQVGRKLRPNDYLLGRDDEWQGIFNRHAREEGADSFGISIRWREKQGRVTVSRSWKLNGNEPLQLLRVKTDFVTDLGQEITEQEICEEFLERRLPKSIIHFFFYDGEQVQQLAEANREGQLRQIERLLDIAALDTLHAYLDKAVSDWRKEGLAAAEEAEYERLRAELRQKEAEQHGLFAQKLEIEEDIENTMRQLDRNRKRIESIRALELQRDEPLLREKIRQIKSQLEEVCKRIADSIPVAAPLWANPLLVEKALAQIAEITGNPTRLLAEEMREILDMLPRRLFDEAPHSTPALTEAQKTHYRKKLTGIFHQYLEPASSAGGLFTLDSGEAASLKRRLDYFQQASTERQRIISDMREASRLRHALAQAETELNSTGHISIKEQEAFKELQANNEALERQRDEKNKDLGSIEVSLDRLAGEIVRKADQIKAQETRLEKSKIASNRIERARQAQRVFEAYKRKLKRTRQAQVETAINHSFKELMTAHHLIDRIIVNEDFALTYLNSNGEPIGMANISAGMKQLAAQALLWALAEAAAKPIPIVIDTPLARIDREHQENLLQRYYPRAAKQVILLPTNSEIDRNKYQIIRPFVRKEFRLHNPRGDCTEIQCSPMYPDLAEH